MESIKRSIYHALRSWKVSALRKPLILQGARQVGKTTILGEFGKREYDSYIHINFDETPDVASIFDADLDPQRIIKELAIRYKQVIHPATTLLIFDEIQECPSALRALKYFCEKQNDYHVIGAGSLLGVKLTGSFPVGKVDFLHMHPLTFFEFLEAVGESELKHYVENLTSVKPISASFHDQLTKWLRYYYIIGGMPEAVANFSEHEDFTMLRRVQQNILNAYELDFVKHAPKEDVAKIMSVWKLIPSQLAKENKKFIFSALGKSARASAYESAIQWLIDAGLVLKSCNISKPSLPLAHYANQNVYKLFALDIGLLGAMSFLDPVIVLNQNELFQEFKGALTENYVAQELSVLSQQPLYYWTSTGTAEVDFITSFKNNIYPLEVKAGFSKKKKSLLVYQQKYQDQQYRTGALSRATLRNFAADGEIINYPLYAVALFPQLHHRAIDLSAEEY